MRQSQDQPLKKIIKFSSNLVKKNVKILRTLVTSKNSTDNISKMNIKRLYVDLTRVKDYFCAMVDTNCDNSQQ